MEGKTSNKTKAPVAAPAQPAEKATSITVAGGKRAVLCTDGLAPWQEDCALTNPSIKFFATRTKGTPSVEMASGNVRAMATEANIATAALKSASPIKGVAFYDANGTKLDNAAAKAAPSGSVYAELSGLVLASFQRNKDGITLS